MTEDVRAEIISRIEGHLYDEAIGAFINQTTDETTKSAKNVIWLDEPVNGEPVWRRKFPAIREKNREFYENRTVKKPRVRT